MPPNLQSMGSLPFTAKDFAELDAWLAEDGWPAAHMDAAMLEGYGRSLRWALRHARLVGAGLVTKTQHPVVVAYRLGAKG